jgi:hypothetical protein
MWGTRGVVVEGKVVEGVVVEGVVVEGKVVEEVVEGESDRMEGDRRDSLERSLTTNTNLYPARDSRLIVAATGPTPVFGFIDQTPFHRIRMHVTQFLNTFFFPAHIEVIVAGLPKGPLLAPLRNRDLQCLQTHRKQFFRRLTQQQVNVFRHHYVPKNCDVMTPEDSRQCFLEKVSRPRRVEIRKTVPTTECDKMRITRLLIPLQADNHPGILQSKKQELSFPTFP